MLLAVFITGPEIVRTGRLTAVDRLMGRKALTIRFIGRRFDIDIPYADALAREESYTFGLVRETYLRNCYLPRAEDVVAIRTAMDCGANRGVFTAFLSRVAEHVVAVEANARYRPIIERNAPRAAVENVLVGSGGVLGANETGTTIGQLLDRHDIDVLDLLKLDIEGSEFALFAGDVSWLSRVRRITMEVHAQHGAPAHVDEILRGHGFSTLSRTENLVRQSAAGHDTSFIYAWR